jgi:5'-3' exoribonuclease 1
MVTVLTPAQKATFQSVQDFVLAHPKPTASALLVLTQRFSAKDRRILQALADDLLLDLAWDQTDKDDQPIVVATFQAAIVDGVSDEDSSSAGGEGDEATQRVLAKWDKAKVVSDDGEADAEEAYERKVADALEEWKRGYYKEKLEFKYPDGSKAEVEKLVYTYIEGLQWVMHYYYTGVASWGWFYNYHYAPRISDLQNVDKMTFNFDYGKPFKPFEQLMGVLPEASKDHIPLAFRVSPSCLSIFMQAL